MVGFCQILFRFFEWKTIDSWFIEFKTLVCYYTIHGGMQNLCWIFDIFRFMFVSFNIGWFDSTFAIMIFMFHLSFELLFQKIEFVSFKFNDGFNNISSKDCFHQFRNNCLFCNVVFIFETTQKFIEFVYLTFYIIEKLL